MPCKDIKCEFCDKTFRKDTIATHVASKHCNKEVIEPKDNKLIKLLLEEFCENPQHSCLNRYASCITAKYNQVYSKTYDGAFYYFGDTPKFFEEDDSFASYIKSEDNMKKHNDFLTEVLSNISLLDFINCQKELIIKSPEFISLKREKQELDKQLLSIKEELESLRNTKEYQAQIIKDFKEVNDSDTIDEMKEQIKEANQFATYYKKEADNYRIQLNRLQERQEEQYNEIIEESISKQRNAGDEIEKLLSRIEKQKVEILDITTKREAFVNTRVEKEIKKVKDKLEKKTEEQIDEMQDKIDELKKKLRKATKKAVTVDSDSD